jgi:tRNA A-37 threonylcarbamoyl transferase component Bud32
MGGETRDLGAAQSIPVHVNRKATTEIKFDLTSSKAELQIRIYNPGGAASGILVSVDEHNRGRTDASGVVRLEVTPGEYVLKVEAPDLEVSQPVSVLIPGTQKVAVHLDREKRRADVLGDLSIPDTDAGELVIERHESTRSQPVSQAGMAATIGRRSVASLQPGGSIGKYDLLAELGRGAMGLVYRARDRKLEREVALKIISDELRNHPVAMQLFLDEAKALAQLNHPNIVGVYDQSEDDGVTYMVMELVEGQTLEEIIAQRGRLPVSEALEIIDQLCAGLAYAHERKVIHRDIKPANIFVTPDRTVKLGDFGLARVMREIAIRRTEIRGTPLYMAPEQVTGTDIDRRADLYAVGCTLFELLTGRPPFTDGDIMFQQLHAAPPRPSTRVGGLPPELDSVVLSCLEKDRKARIGSATLLRERLRSVRP